MWALRRLNGPQAGQIYILKPGKNRVGRNAGNDLHLNTAGVSKDHLEIQVAGTNVLVKDLNSSNGTFVNGVRIQTSALRLGDKLGVDRVLFDVVPAQMSHPVPQAQSSAAPNSAMVPYQQQSPSLHVAMDTAHTPQTPAAAETTANGLQSFKEKTERYFNQVLMPGLYSLVEVFQFRTVMMGFGFVFVFLVTLLSIFPMNQITSESIKTESRRRALTVARALANSNEKAVRSGEMSGYTADLVLRDEGISHVYILGKDGSIIAPPEMVGLNAKELGGFASQIKGSTREISADVGSGKIAASCPILVFDPELQQNVAKAHAVVVYDTGSLKFDDGRALSLFIQMLAMALMVGAVMFLLMYKLIEYPFLRLHEELDAAMREGRDHAEIRIQMPLLHQLLVGINSLLTRVNQGGGTGAASVASTQDHEWSNMIQLFGYPALLLSKDFQIVAINSAFESLTGTQSHIVQGQALAYLPDQALQKNIQELSTQAQNNTGSLHQDRLEISGHLFNLQCQAITVAGEARYYLIGISPVEQAEGGAA
jgi:uncharacterized membrane protein